MRDCVGVDKDDGVTFQGFVVDVSKKKSRNESKDTVWICRIDAGTHQCRDGLEGAKRRTRHARRSTGVEGRWFYGLWTIEFCQVDETGTTARRKAGIDQNFPCQFRSRSLVQGQVLQSSDSVMMIVLVLDCKIPKRTIQFFVNNGMKVIPL